MQSFNQFERAVFEREQFEIWTATWHWNKMLDPILLDPQAICIEMLQSLQCAFEWAQPTSLSICMTFGWAKHYCHAIHEPNNLNVKRAQNVNVLLASKQITSPLANTEIWLNVKA